MEGIPAELIINWDQTGLNLVPSSSWTMERKVSSVLKSKVFKTSVKCNCCVCCFTAWRFSVYPDHLWWENKSIPSTIHFFRRLVNLPLTKSLVKWRHKGCLHKRSNPTLCWPSSFDVSCQWRSSGIGNFWSFLGPVDTKITQILEENNIQSMLVPPGCTERLQPLDALGNMSVKCFLRLEYQNLACQWNSRSAGFPWCWESTTCWLINRGQ